MVGLDKQPYRFPTLTRNQRLMPERESMLRSKLPLFLIISLFVAGCTKQTPEQAPGTAAIINLKQAVHIGQVATMTTRDALPAFIADPEDVATAQGIVNDIDKALAGLDTKLAPYTSLDVHNQIEIKKLVGDTLDFLRQMDSAGVSHIKNPKLKARVQLGLGLASGALALWQPSAG